MNYPDPHPFYRRSLGESIAALRESITVARQLRVRPKLEEISERDKEKRERQLASETRRYFTAIYALDLPELPQCSGCGRRLADVVAVLSCPNCGRKYSPRR